MKLLALCSLLLAFCVLLFAIAAMPYAPCSVPNAFAADKLVVKDSGGTTKFVVTDEGKVGIGTTVPVQ